MRISQALYAELVEHALLEAPRECCGMVACRGDDAVHVFRCENAAASEFRFEIDGLDQMRITRAIEAAGWQLGAIYHSHTRASAYPSKLDILTARPYAHVLHVIVGVADADPEVRAYRMVDEQVIEAPLTVTYVT